jgi:low affinity Fe/Cu permease
MDHAVIDDPDNLHDLDAGVPGRPPAPPTASHAKNKSSTSKLAEPFRRFAHHVSNVVGSPATFIAAVALIVVWAATGPFMHYSETWQLVINTATTIATFLMVFLIQNTQNRDARAIHLKLDELIHGVKGARNKVIDLQDRSDEELLELEREFKELHERALETRTQRHAARKHQHHAAHEHHEGGEPYRTT